MHFYSSKSHSHIETYCEKVIPNTLIVVVLREYVFAECRNVIASTEEIDDPMLYKVYKHHVIECNFIFKAEYMYSTHDKNISYPAFKSQVIL